MFNSLKIILIELKYFIIGNLLSFLATKNNKLLHKNKNLHNKYSDNRIFIFYSGRSIRNLDFSMFKDEYVMGTNLLALHENFVDLNTNFYVYTGSWNYSLSKYMAWGLHEICDGLNSESKLILNSSSKFWISNLNYCGIVDDMEKFKDNTYFISNKSFILKEGCGVNCNLPRSHHGVLSRSIGIAIDLGFKEIFLVGSDYSKDPLKVGHFYGSTDFISDRTDNEVSVYKGISDYAKQKNIEIYNVVDDGFSSPFFKEVNQSQLSEFFN